MSNVFDFIHRANKFDVINFRYEFKIKDFHNPDAETVLNFGTASKLGCSFNYEFIIEFQNNSKTLIISGKVDFRMDSLLKNNNLYTPCTYVL